ncbi:Multiprotein-bridging factor 1a [Dionaea muscipula]
MAGIGPISQDWEPVVFRKKAPAAAAAKDQKVVNAARRAGAEIETIRKDERVPTDLKKAIMQARTEKKLTQSQLAQLINEKPQIIQEYESGKAIPNQQIIGKLERALSVKLQGKK